jgi:ferredoxin-thioredoxin reductase catalytic subunit
MNMPKKAEPNTSDNLTVLRERVSAFCTKAGYKLSTDSENILRDIVKMKESAGDYYCTCQVGRSADSVCVCLPVRNGLVDVMGTCYCNLIVSGTRIKE